MTHSDTDTHTFVNLAQNLDVIDEALRTRGVLVSGATSSGKSTLALELAHRCTSVPVDEIRDGETARSFLTSPDAARVGVIHAHDGGGLRRLLHFALTGETASAIGERPLEVNVTKQFDAENRPAFFVRVAHDFFAPLVGHAYAGPRLFANETAPAVRSETLLSDIEGATADAPSRRETSDFWSDSASELEAGLRSHMDALVLFFLEHATRDEINSLGGPAFAATSANTGAGVVRTLASQVKARAAEH
jgi:hypothetical protein